MARFKVFKMLSRISRWMLTWTLIALAIVYFQWSIILQVFGQDGSPYLLEYNNVPIPERVKLLWTARDLKAMPRAFRSRDRYPRCFIIGARKAGTTALQAFLERHPQIWTRYWEDGFFSREDFYTRGLYRWLHPLPANASQVNLVKVAEYFHLARVPPRMFAVNNATKFLLIVTDPVRRLISDYLFMRRYTKQPNLAEHFHSFEELLFQPGSQEIDRTWPCLTRSLYCRHFAVWLKWFPRDQFMVIDGDAFIGDNPALQLQQVEQFLNIQPFFKERDFFYNETKGFYCHQNFGCLGGGKGHTDFSLAPSTEESLRDFFKPFNRNFYQLVGQDFNWK